MAAFDFPPTPAVGTLYPLVAEVGKPQYRWNGSEWTAASFDPAGYVKRSGDAMTGALSLNGDPTQALHAVPKQYLDAQRQRISLAGVKQFDVQVPAGATATRLSGVICPTTATPFQILIQLSVAAGVFRSTVGDYAFSGFGQTANTATIANNSGTATVSGMYLGGHSHATLPCIFDGFLQLKKPNVAAFFSAETRSGSWAAALTHSYYQHYLAATAAGTALEILAFRLLGSGPDNWAAESYLHVEWL